MSNLYIFYGNDADEISSSVDLSVSVNAKKHEINDFKTYRIDLQDELKEFYDSEATVSLFSAQSIVKVYLSQRGLKHVDKDVEAFIDKIQFLSNSKIVYLIIVFTRYDKNAKALIQKSDLVKSFKQSAEIKEFVKLRHWQKNELKSKIQENLKELGLTMKSDALELMQDALKEGTFNIVQELNKIKTYIMPDTEISKTVVSDFYLTSYNADDLYDYLLFKKIQLNDLQQGLKNVGAPLYLLAVLQGKFRESYKIKACLEDGISKQEITKTLGIHPYRLDLMIAKIRAVDIGYLKSIILQLSNIEYKLKTGKLDNATVLDRILLLQA